MSGASTDFLIAFGVASIVPAAVASYAVPLAVMFVVGIIYCTLYFFVASPVFFGEKWLERGIFGWGWATAAVATGIALNEHGLLVPLGGQISTARGIRGMFSLKT